ERARAVAADDVVRTERLLRAIAFDDDTYATRFLHDRARGPAETAVGRIERCEFRPQHRFHPVLRQALIVLKIIRAHDLAAGRRLPVFAHQIAVGGDFADRIAGRHDARGAQLVLDPPEVEMLERALREVLPLRDAIERRAAFDQHAANSLQGE